MKDFFIACSELIPNIMEDLENTNYGSAKEKVKTLSDIVERFKKNIEYQHNSKNIDILEKVKKILTDKLALGYRELQLNSLIVDDLGADSLDQVELIMAFEDEYDIEIPDEDAERLKTVKDIAEYLTKRI
jgi:acyl carrier protein